MDSKFCERCNKEFTKPYSTSRAAWKKRRFCSKACWKNPPHQCEACGRFFRARGSRVIRCCSFLCARKVQPNYKGGISREGNPSQFSFGQRQRIWRRENATCQDCGAKVKDMVVHHTTFTKDILPDTLLRLLCRPCHMRTHAQHDRLVLNNF